MQSQYILISQFTTSSGLYNFYDILILIKTIRVNYFLNLRVLVMFHLNRKLSNDFI